MRVPQIVPVSEMVHDRKKILAMADREPVILASRSKARAVLVGIEEWNHIQDVLEMHRAYMRTESARVQQEMEGKEWIDADALLDKWAAKHGVEDAAPLLER